MLLPKPVNFYAPAMTYAVIFVAIHLLTVPFIAARCVGVTPSDLLRPLGRPAGVTVVSTGVLLWCTSALGTRSPWAMGAALAAFAGVFGLGAFLFTLTPQERRTLLRIAPSLRQRPVPLVEGAAGIGPGPGVAE
jgi:hypothetical protein